IQPDHGIVIIQVDYSVGAIQIAVDKNNLDLVIYIVVKTCPMYCIEYGIVFTVDQIVGQIATISFGGKLDPVWFLQVQYDPCFGPVLTGRNQDIRQNISFKIGILLELTERAEHMTASLGPQVLSTTYH